MITKNTLIGDLIHQKSEAVPILVGFDMDCVGCSSSQMESIEEATMVHGFDCQKILGELNK